MESQLNNKHNDSPNEGNLEGEKERKRYADGVHAGLDKAKKELNQTMERLRSEIDRIDVQKAKNEAREWIRENPALAIVIGIGAGVIVGRLLGRAFSPPSPVQTVEAVYPRDRTLAQQAKEYATLIGASVARHAYEASRKAKATGEQVLRKASEVGSQLTDEASEWVDTLSEQTGEVADHVRTAARMSAEKMEDVAHELGDTWTDRTKQARAELSRQTRRGLAITETVLDGIRAMLATFVFKRIMDWVKRVI